MWFLENLVLTKHYKTGPKNCSAADCHEIKIVNYTKEDYEEVISIFKSGCNERISYSLTHGWKKPRVVMFLSTSFFLIPISIKYAIICLILLWFFHAYCVYWSIYYSYNSFHMSTDMKDRVLRFWTTPSNAYPLAKVSLFNVTKFKTFTQPIEMLFWVFR